MATLTELKAEIVASDDYKDLTDNEWDEKIKYRGLHKRSEKDFAYFEDLYPKKISMMRARLTGDWDFSCKVSDDGQKLNSDAEILDAVKAKTDEWYYLQAKAERLLDKLACAVKEQELRKDGVVVRTGIHDQADYYIDYDNGADTNDGLKRANDAAEAGTDATHIYVTKDTLDDDDSDDYFNNAYVYNVTRSAGAQVSDYDYDNGSGMSVLTTGNIANQTSGDTFYIIMPYKTITKYTTTEARTKGDRAFLRANITWDQGTEATNINCDENGDEDDYISIIGCDSTTNDPWGDADDTLPIVDFEDTAYYWYQTDDLYWWVERIDFRQSAGEDGTVYCRESNGSYYKNCVIRDAHDSGQEAIYLYASTDITIDGCTFIDNYNAAIYAAYAGATIKNCTSNGGTDVSTNYGIVCNSSVLYISDSSFGVTTAYDNGLFVLYRASRIYMRNVDHAGTILFDDQGSVVYSEDDDATFEAQLNTHRHGTITRDTTDARSGGSDSYATMAPGSACGVVQPLILGHPMRGFAQVWVEAGSYTVTVYVRDNDNWATQPGNSGGEGTFFIRTSELDNAGNATRVERDSAQDTTYVDSDNWVAFTTSISPAREGWVYIWAYLGAYESGKTIDVDILPTVT